MYYTICKTNIQDNSTAFFLNTNVNNLNIPTFFAQLIKNLFFLIRTARTDRKKKKKKQNETKQHNNKKQW